MDTRLPDLSIRTVGNEKPTETPPSRVHVTFVFIYAQIVPPLTLSSCWIKASLATINELLNVCHGYDDVLVPFNATVRRDSYVRDQLNSANFHLDARAYDLSLVRTGNCAAYRDRLWIVDPNRVAIGTDQPGRFRKLPGDYRVGSVACVQECLAEVLAAIQPYHGDFFAQPESRLFCVCVPLYRLKAAGAVWIVAARVRTGRYHRRA
jgi:hypothetical protein